MKRDMTRQALAAASAAALIMVSQGAAAQTKTGSGTVTITYTFVAPPPPGTVNSVPEPGTLGLLGAGIAALAVARRRRKTA
jgi:ABC-type glycerol-3-phosphate transport system substrate-binding protein